MYFSLHCISVIGVSQYIAEVAGNPTDLPSVVEVNEIHRIHLHVVLVHLCVHAYY